MQASYRRLGLWIGILLVLLLSGFWSPNQAQYLPPNQLASYYQYLAQHPGLLRAAHLPANLQSSQLGPVFEQAVSHLIQTRGQLPPLEANAVKTRAADYLITRNLAFSLWLELNHLVPWSLAEYNPAQLELMFYYPQRPRLWEYAVLFTTPDKAYALWQQYVAHGQRLSRQETALQLAQWIRDHVGHHGEPYLPKGVDDFFEMRIPGPDQVNNGQLNLVGSCQNNNRWLAAMGSALNIPVYYGVYSDNAVVPAMAKANSHSFVDFPTESLALIHSDDLYRYNWLGALPVRSIFLTGPDRLYFLQHAEFTDRPNHPINPVEADKMFDTYYVKTLFQSPSEPLKAAACNGLPAVLALFEARNGRPFLYPDEVRRYFVQYQPVLQTHCQNNMGQQREKADR